MSNKRKKLLARSASPASKRTKQLHINENSSIEEFISFLKSELALEEVDYDEDTKKKWEKAFGHLQENVNVSTLLNINKPLPLFEYLGSINSVSKYIHARVMEIKAALVLDFLRANPESSKFGVDIYTSKEDLEKLKYPDYLYGEIIKLGKPLELSKDVEELILSNDKTEETLARTIVKDCWETFRKQLIFAPYFALVQSSGSGKTTCMKLILKQFPNNLYLNLNSTKGYSKDSTKFKKIIPACANQDYASAKKIIYEYLDSITFEMKEDNLFVLCIDEAKCMCEAKVHYHNEEETFLELFRKLLAEYGLLQKKIVVVLADTVSTVGNFVPPPYKYDPHLRISATGEHTLFPVIYNIPFFDVHLENKIFEEEINIEELISCGRPLWYSSYLEAGKDHKKLTNFINFKLHSDLSEKNKLIASYAVRLSFEFISNQIIEKLIARSLAYCTYVSQDRSYIKCNFLSEPIVAEIAKNHLQKNISSSLQVLKEYFIRNHINIGDVGETIAQIICLDAYDKCLPHSVYTTFTYFPDLKNYYVTLKQFLSLLLPEYIIDEFPNYAEDYCLFFNHFIELEEELNFTILSKALRRCCALKLHKNCKGADLAFPIFDKTQGFGTEVVAVLWIQVKSKLNESSTKIKESLDKKLHFDYIVGSEKIVEFKDLKSFGIHLNLNSQDPKPIIFHPNCEDEQIIKNYVEEYIQNNATQTGVYKWEQFLEVEYSEKSLDLLNLHMLKTIASKIHIDHQNLNKKDLISAFLERKSGEITVVDKDENIGFHLFKTDNIFNCSSFLNSDIKSTVFHNSDYQNLIKEILSFGKQAKRKGHTFNRIKTLEINMDEHNHLMTLYKSRNPEISEFS